MNRLLSLFVGLWGASSFKNWALRGLGHTVHPSAQVAPIVLLGSTRLDLAAHSRIGALTAIRGVRVSLGKYAVVGQLNWISAAPFLVSASMHPNAGSLIIGRDSSITNRHYVDASGGVRIGDFATVAGVRSTLMTHGIDIDVSRLRTAPITIGDYSMIGSNTALVLGCNVPARSVIAMGSVVVKGLADELSLYGGVPARRIRALSSTSAYFRRSRGEVLPMVEAPAVDAVGRVDPSRR